MPMNKQSGNMYAFVTHTINFCKGRCEFDCLYCYMKVFPQKEIHFDEKELKTDLGENNYIFVGSSTDMFSPQIPREWILKVLEHCKKYNNTYLFQSKNPKRFLEFIDLFPKDSILCTTIESNRDYKISKAPSVQERANIMSGIKLRKTLTLEPLMDFDLEPMLEIINKINPEFISIGSDSKGHNLEEPSKEKVNQLIFKLKDLGYKLKIKDNLGRLT